MSGNGMSSDFGCPDVKHHARSRFDEVGDELPGLLR
ncbi:MAG: hypothetical protein QOC67_2442 [Pseudonocardiales bacterium]|nr:hypothetical protein [Pseudonocardiales bacterium]